MFLLRLFKATRKGDEGLVVRHHRGRSIFIRNTSEHTLAVVSVPLLLSETFVSSIATDMPFLGFIDGRVRQPGQTISVIRPNCIHALGMEMNRVRLVFGSFEQVLDSPDETADKVDSSLDAGSGTTSSSINRNRLRVRYWFSMISTQGREITVRNMISHGICTREIFCLGTSSSLAEAVLSLEWDYNHSEQTTDISGSKPSEQTADISGSKPSEQTTGISGSIAFHAETSGSPGTKLDNVMAEETRLWLRRWTWVEYLVMFLASFATGAMLRIPSRVTGAILNVLLLLLVSSIYRESDHLLHCLSTIVIVGAGMLCRGITDRVVILGDMLIAVIWLNLFWNIMVLALMMYVGVLPRDGVRGVSSILAAQSLIRQSTVEQIQALRDWLREGLKRSLQSGCHLWRCVKRNLVGIRSYEWPPDVVPSNEKRAGTGGHIALDKPCFFEDKDLGIRLQVQESADVNPSGKKEWAKVDNTPEAIICEGVYMGIKKRVIFGPAGAAFSKPILLYFELEDGKANARGTELVVFRKGDGSWRKKHEGVHVVVDDSGGGTKQWLRLEVDHFCSYALVGQAIQRGPKHQRPRNRFGFYRSMGRYIQVVNVTETACTSSPSPGRAKNEFPLLAILIPLDWVRVVSTATSGEADAFGFRVAASRVANMEGTNMERLAMFTPSSVMNRTDNNTWMTYVSSKMGEDVGIILATMRADSSLAVIGVQIMEVGTRMEVDLSKVSLDYAPYSAVRVKPDNMVPTALEVVFGGSSRRDRDGNATAAVIQAADANGGSLAHAMPREGPILRKSQGSLPLGTEFIVPWAIVILFLAVVVGCSWPIPYLPFATDQ